MGRGSGKLDRAVSFPFVTRRFEGAPAPTGAAAAPVPSPSEKQRLAEEQKRQRLAVTAVAAATMAKRANFLGAAVTDEQVRCLPELAEAVRLAAADNGVYLPSPPASLMAEIAADLSMSGNDIGRYVPPLLVAEAMYPHQGIFSGRQLGFDDHNQLMDAASRHLPSDFGERFGRLQRPDAAQLEAQLAAKQRQRADYALAAQVARESGGPVRPQDAQLLIEIARAAAEGLGVDDYEPNADQLRLTAMHATGLSKSFRPAWREDWRNIAQMMDERLTIDIINDGEAYLAQSRKVTELLGDNIGERLRALPWDESPVAAMA